jgi:hypothetical protein
VMIYLSIFNRSAHAPRQCVAQGLSNQVVVAYRSMAAELQNSLLLFIVTGLQWHSHAGFCRLQYQWIYRYGLSVR